MQYKVTYTDGGGTEYDEGIWELKITPKAKTVTKIEGGGIFDNFEVGTKKKIGLNTGNPIKNEYDDGFTVYFEQMGIPYNFQLLK